MAYSSVELDAGSGGDTIATDTVSTKKYQIVKVATGGEGTATEISNANPVPISDAGGSITVDGTVTATVSGVATAANQSTANTALSAIQTAVQLIDNAISGSEMQVDVVGSLPAGTNAIGKLAANSGVDIGDVDVTSVAPGTAASSLGKAEDAAHTSSDVGVMMLAVRRDAAAVGSTTDGDYSTVNVDASGRVWVHDPQVLAALGGTLVVDGSGVTQPVSGTVTANLGATDNAVLDTIASPVATISATPLQRVAIFDAADAQITSFGGGTQYTEDAAAAADPVGNTPIFVRQDTPATLTTADGDNVAGRATNYGAQFVQIVTSSGSFVDSFSGSGGTSEVDDADFTAATTAGTPAMGVYESTPTNVTDGDLGIAGITITRELKTSDASAAALLTTIDADTGNIATAAAAIQAAAEIMDDWDESDRAKVNPIAGQAGVAAGAGAVGATTQRVTLASDDPGVVLLDSSATLLGTIDADTSTLAAAVVTEDAAAAADPVGTTLVLVRRDTLSATEVSADGDNVAAKAASTGAQYVEVTAGTTKLGDATNGLLVNLGSNNDVTVTSGTITSAGAAAHDAAVSGNPTRIAGRALTADYTAVATGDTADLISTTLGKQVVMPYAIPGATWSYAAASGGITNTTGVTAKAAGTGSERQYITHVSVVNGHATVGTDVQIRDGAAGTVLWRSYAVAAGGGVSEKFDPPLRGSAATLVEIANGTTGSATYFNLQGYTAAE